MTDVHLAAVSELFDDPPGLLQKMRIFIQCRHVRTAASELDAVKAGIAAQVECPPTGQISRKMLGDLFPLECREVAERVIRCGLRSVREMDIVKPRLEGSCVHR